MIVLAILTLIVFLLIPGLIAHLRDVRYKWVITILAIIPLYGITWFAALLWAIWPKEK